ncbi:NlpC/P60 family protein [Brevibacillus ginsengisoli]|uniref:C40 family peptidase n=1 Tax=Brevibacillus ginsengisoli TaxID=363854 RepID=UPI003CF6D311
MKRHMILFMTSVVLGLGFPLTTYASSQSVLYTVAQGDSLFQISKKYQTSVQSIMEANHLANDKLHIGQQLQVPTTHPSLANGSTTAPAPNSSTVNKPVQNQSVKQPIGNATVAAQPSPTAPQPVPDAKETHQTTALEANTQAKVTVPVLNVREQASTDSAILSKLSLGAIVNVIDSDSDWTKINYNGQDAYVATPYITSYVPVELSPNADNQSLLEIVQPLLNTPYVLGGTTPDGFDCSGFTSYVYKQLGVTLPRTSEDQFTVGQDVPRDQLQPGDLLFYDSLKKGKISHVAMYIGDGMIIHANGEIVKYEKVANMDKIYPYYGAKRMIQF